MAAYFSKEEVDKMMTQLRAGRALLAALEEVNSWRMQMNLMPPEIRGAWMRAEAAICQAKDADIEASK